MKPYLISLAAGLVIGVIYSLLNGEYPADVREAITDADPRSDNFKEEIIEASYTGIKGKPGTTFGNVKADVLADKDPISIAATSAA
jgi:hypothetical protein